MVRLVPGDCITRPLTADPCRYLHLSPQSCGPRSFPSTKSVSTKLQCRPMCLWLRTTKKSCLSDPAVVFLIFLCSFLGGADVRRIMGAAKEASWCPESVDFPHGILIWLQSDFNIPIYDPLSQSASHLLSLTSSFRLSVY